MKDKEMTEGERNAYNRGATRWGIGVGLAMMVAGWAGLFHAYDVWTTRLIDCQGGAETMSIFPSAHADEPDHKDLFALNKPANACEYDDDVIAWQRDDRFATQLRVWCVERIDDAEGDRVVVWTQAENQLFASRMVIDTMFYSQKVLLDDESKKPYVDAAAETDSSGGA